jgi:hypothetical protein
MIAKRVADERGYAMAIVIIMLMIALLMGGAGLAETLSSHSLTNHDARERRAQQAADAGVQARLFDATESNLASSYNFSGGVLGLGGFLDCTPLQLDANLNIAGLTAYASTAGICPQALDPGGNAKTFWSALDHHTYYQSEFFSNKKEISGSGFGSVVEFPQIVSVGCDTTSPATCGTTPAPSSNAYSRELVYLAPTGPLQAIEGMGNVTINGLKVLGINTAAVVNGDVMAAGSLTVPAVGVAVNSNWPATGILPTFGYGTSISSSITTANIVHLTGGYCSSGNPTTSCMIKRLSPSQSATTCANCTTGITCSPSCSGGGYNASSDTFTLTGGGATFAGGDYVFCNFNATGGSLTASPSATTPVRIFIRSPSSCGGSGGNFTAATGFNNSLRGVVNGVANTVDPSGIQIYVQGDGSYDNATTVNVGTSGQGTPLSQAMIIYAPTSAVTVNTGACSLLLGLCSVLNTAAAGTFSGNIVGDNVSITSGVITQDLGIGNYPLYSGTNAFRPVQYVQCSTSVTTLSGSSSDTNGC